MGNKTKGSMSCTLCFRICSKIQYHLKQQLFICTDIKRKLKSMSKLVLSPHQEHSIDVETAIQRAAKKFPNQKLLRVC